MFFLRVAVWWSEGANFGDLGGGSTEQEVADILNASLLIGVQVGDHGEKNVLERVVLNTNDGTHARVDAGSGGVLEARAVDVAGSESQRWKTGVDVGEPVVVIGDVELSGILS